MNRMSKSLAVAVLGGGSMLGAFFGTTVVQNVRFAHAAEQVQASREQLAQFPLRRWRSKARRTAPARPPGAAGCGGVAANPSRDPFPDDALV